jgi:hypothetical protein
MIRNKRDVWRERPSDHAGEHENILLAKTQDSESENSAVNYIARLTRTLIARRMQRT